MRRRSCGRICEGRPKAMRIEHANLSVHDAGAMTRFLQAVSPDFVVRGQGLDARGRPWRHVGNDVFYVALQTVTEGEVRTPYDDTPGMNHLGWVVDSVDALEARMREAGFTPNLRVSTHPARIRLYFYDPEGNDWEFVEYLREDASERNDYRDA